MRFATIQLAERRVGARVQDDRVILLDAVDAVQAWAANGNLPEIGELRSAQAHFAVVSPTPSHILCVGLNYRSHIAQLGYPLPAYPTMFAKFRSTLTGPREEIALPTVSEHIQGEVELAVIVGHRLRRADAETAAAAIAGFTVANDLSMRDWQHRTSESLQGKVFDRSTPLGPALVTPDEVDDARDLALSFQVDGIEWQHGSTADLLFSPAELLSYCSQFMTLERGDVILTGTPGVTAAASDVHGDSLLVTAIDGLGESVNPTREDVAIVGWPDVNA